jgi:hypothetical protein
MLGVVVKNVTKPPEFSTGSPAVERTPRPAREGVLLNLEIQEELFT